MDAKPASKLLAHYLTLAYDSRRENNYGIGVLREAFRAPEVEARPGDSGDHRWGV